MDEHAFKSLSQITRIDTDDEEVAEMIPKTVWCILKSVKSVKSVVKIPLITPATSAFGLNQPLIALIFGEILSFTFRCGKRIP